MEEERIINRIALIKSVLKFLNHQIKTEEFHYNFAKPFYIIIAYILGIGVCIFLSKEYIRSNFDFKTLDYPTNMELKLKKWTTL